MIDQEQRYKLALLRIKGWTAPHQQIDIHDAVSIICDIWNEAKEALGETDSDSAVPRKYQGWDDGRDLED